MDDHSGFLNNTPLVLQEEKRLIRTADLVIASSERLLQSVEGRSKKTLLVRNGCDFEHFGAVSHLLRARHSSLLIGYYGAIAEWFDTALVAELARIRADWRFEMIGSTLGGDVRCLEDLPNVRFLGERPYGLLPELIHGWDAFLIPFKRIPLTEATNPVKVYEMLAMGKPVVAVPLPELAPIADLGLIRLAEGAPRLAEEILSSIADSTPEMVERRREFARRNTWNVRHQALAKAISHEFFSRTACSVAS
jgi:glycosyltransferase involved in cell wall biosynthesis